MEAVELNEVDLSALSKRIDLRGCSKCPVCHSIPVRFEIKEIPKNELL